MQKKILEYVQRYQMITEQDRVVAGVSGGADSVCLFFVLLALQQVIPFELGVVHVNHGLRSDAADQDEAFVEALCKKQGVAYQAYTFPVAEIADTQKLTLEEAGREVRRQAFEDFAAQWGGTKIALAHHQNDVAETMLHNLTRGSGIAGLCSVRPVRNQYIRPLLCMNRLEIEQYLKERGIAWQEDSTNASEAYTRNKIRHQVVSYLVKEINPKAVEHMADTAQHLLEAELYLEQQTATKRDAYVKVDGAKIFVAQELRSESAIIQKYLLRDCIRELAGSSQDISSSHLEMLKRLLENQVGKTNVLPQGLVAKRTYGGIMLEKVQQQGARFDLPKLQLTVPGQCRSGDLQVECSVFKAVDKRFPEKRYTKWFDYDKINDNLVLRSRQSGDYIITCASGGSKKLKDYFIDAKIPQEERDSILLLASGSEILWVVGYRMSERCKINQNTEQILSVQIKERDIHE